jgi:glycosyltransferase involved in cell wall biosynthesis
VSAVRLSVVIPCYDAEAVIAAQLAALSRQEWDAAWEVVVSENGSADRSREVVEGFRDRLPKLRVVDSSHARGAARARNVGIQHARGDLILTCDADDVVADDYVPVMAAALEAHDFVSARLETDRLNETWQTESWKNGQATGLLQSYPPFLPFAAGASLGFRRYVFDLVGGFDPRFQKREDQDFCWRVQLAGVPLHFVSETAIHYRYPTEPREMYRQSRALAEDGVNIYKHYGCRGMPRLTWRQALGGEPGWMRLLRQLWHVRHYDRTRRAKFVRDLGRQVGRLRGSLRYRTLAP